MVLCYFWHLERGSSGLPSSGHEGGYETQQQLIHLNLLIGHQCMGNMDTDSHKPAQLVMRVWAFTETVVSGDNVPNIAKGSSTHIYHFYHVI